MAAEVKLGDVYVGQQRQCVGQGVFVGQVGDGDDGALPGEPACGSRPTAEMSQAHDRCPLAAIIHRPNKARRVGGGKGFCSQMSLTISRFRWSLPAGQPINTRTPRGNDAAAPRGAPCGDLEKIGATRR